MTTQAEELTPHQRWMKEITAAEKELSKFHRRARNVTKKFLDERDTATADNKWFNIFYANTNILESALYSQLPKPKVSRRFKDYDDDISRVAALILERSITQDLDDPRDTFDSTLRHCVQDRLVPGLAQAWLRLETDTEVIDDLMPPSQPDAETEEVGEVEQPGTEAQPEPLTRITDQRVVVDYVFWEDFLISPCRIWEERLWVGRRVYMDRKELVERFGEEKGNAVSLDHRPQGAMGNEVQGSTPIEENHQKAVVYELWERSTRKVIWLARGYEQLLDERDDPLKLVGFEPCPKPMLANVSTSNVTPRPDYYMIQDQYTELDNVNNRISMLVQACKVVGTYDKSAAGVSRMLTEGFDNQLVPVDNWAMFAEKGGLKGTIDWLPLDQVVQALQRLNEAREIIKGQIYELTGISDIVRGASKASETLGAQEIKSQFASIRIKKLQDEVARFASDIMRLKAEIQIKHFDPMILVKKSNIEATGNDQFIGPALALLKSDEGFEWRVQVTADSIAQADYAMEKADRIELLTAVSAYLEKALPMFQAIPGSASLLVGMLKWAVAGFRNSAEIETLLDQELQNLMKNPPQNDKPDPEAQKMQMEQQKMQQEAALKEREQQQQMAADAQKAQMEQQKMQMEIAMEEQRLYMEMNAEKQRLAMEQQMMQMQMMFEQAMNAMKLGAARDQNQLKLETQAAQAEQAAQAAKAKESQSAE